ncbi:MAG: SufD family Fe-S cluster assembly protein [Clostridiales bacterium]|nr:SufD family Fe-S cluster assembly protein [Clostridiales bacterium]
MSGLDQVTQDLLSLISDWDGKYKGAYNIRVDSTCAGRQSSDNIAILSKDDKPGLEIRVRPGTKGEKVSIPACVTHGNVDDLVYNDFYIGEGADITIVAGCGVHTTTGEPARHNGIHRFFLSPGARVKYIEKHVGTGKGKGLRTIDPVTEAFLEKGAYLEMDTSQIGGVDRTTRETRCTLGEDARLVIRERLLTEKDQNARTLFTVTMQGDNSAADVVSRSVARDDSRQVYESTIIGEAKCTGHTECDAIISDRAQVDASPRLFARNEDAALIHEAAIGKIAGEQILKLRTLGLTREEAEARIVEGFLS